jgi:transcriptional regulator with XRE-family HTH domain
MSDSKRYNRIAEVMAEKGLTGKALAAKAGKREETISGYCTQKFQPTIATLFELADILEVDVRELLVPNTRSPHKNFKF